MGHLSKRALKQNAPKAVNGLNIDSSPVEEKPCHGCELGKSSRLPFPSSSKRASSPLEIVHSDLVGPLQCKSIQGNTYFATFLDDFSKTVVVIFLKAKSEFKHAFEIYKAWAEKQLNAQMKCLHSDRGGEYVNKDLRAILDASGIEHMLTMPHSPQQNGRAERFNRTIMEKGTSMLHHAGLSLGFWQVAVEAAVHIYNRTPSRSNNWRTPLERWDSTIPDVSYFRVFGCGTAVVIPSSLHKMLHLMKEPFRPGLLWQSSRKIIFHPCRRSYLLIRLCSMEILANLHQLKPPCLRPLRKGSLHSRQIHLI